MILLLAFLVQRSDTHARTDVQQRASVHDCQRASERAALSANGWRTLSERVAKRNGRGDKESARVYMAVGFGQLETVPVPEGYKITLRLAEVRPVHSDNGQVIKFVLTEDAKELQRRGCERAYQR